MTSTKYVSIELASPNLVAGQYSHLQCVLSSPNSPHTYGKISKISLAQINVVLSITDDPATDIPSLPII